jgi:hypothetical protein
MNLKTTLVLLVFAVAGGALLFVPAVVPHLALVTPPAAPTGDTLRVLEDELTADNFQAIEVRKGDQVVQLGRGADGSWSLPGNWPTRQAQVSKLVGLLSGLRSRFEPAQATELDKKGLDNPAVTVTVRAGDKEYRLAFGEPSSDEQQQGPEDRSVFARPTWLRLAEKSGDSFIDQPEVVRLAPGLVAELDRPLDYYQQRRLFPAERVAKEGDTQEKEERLTAQAVAVEDKRKPGESPEEKLEPSEGKKPEEKKAGRGSYALKRNGDEWELEKPVRDRVDPDRLKTLLAAVPDIWAEEFVQKPKKDLAEYGLKEPEQTLRVTLPGGETRTLLIGKVSQMKVRMVTKPSPPGLPLPPQREPVHDEYRYAKLQANEQVFEVRSERLKDVFVAADTLRDARLARFRTEDANRLEIERPGQKDIVLAKKDGRWHLEQPLDADAESTKISELLDKLSFLEARGPDVIDNADAKKLKEMGLNQPQATVKVTAEEEVKGADAKDKKKVTKTFAFALGKREGSPARLYVRVEGWPRVNEVEDAVLPLAERPALAYRGRRVLDFLGADVDAIKVQHGAETVALKQAEGKWSLTEPVKAEADAVAAEQLAGDLGRLEAVEYVNESPKSDELEPLYGLGKPAASATVTFRDAKKPAQTLLVGKQRPNHQDYFAKLAAADSVFAVKKDLRDALDKGSLAYLPQTFPRLQPEQVAELRIQKEGQDEYRLTHKDGSWKVATLDDAAAVPALVQPMVDELANLRAERYEAYGVKDLARYGLDKPHLRLTVVLSPKKDAAGKEEKQPERVLLVGKLTDKEPGTRFAKLGDGDAVFVVGDKLVAAVDKGALELLDRRLLTLDPARIERLGSKAGDSALAIQRDKDAWKVVESPAPPFTADPAAVDEVLNVWSNLHAQRFVAYGAKADLAKYGLDRPAATVTVSVKPAADPKKPEPAEHTLELGKPAEEGGGRYARLDKGPGVVVLDGWAADELLHTYLDYVNRTVLTFDPMAVTALVRKKGDDDLEVARRDDHWFLGKPAEQRADDATVQQLLVDLTQRARRVAAYPASDLKPFGLDAPAAVVTVRVEKDGKPAELVLKIGKPAEDPGPAARSPDHFAQAAGAQTVVVLPGGLVEGLLAGPLGFRNRTVAEVRDDIDRVVVERGPRKAVFASVDGTWKLVEPLEAAAEHKPLQDLIDTVSRLRAGELVAEKPTDAQLKGYGLDKPETHWRFQAGDKDVLGLALGRREKGGGRCYAKLDKGDLVFVLDAPLTAKLFGEYRQRDVWSPSLDSAQADRLTYTRGGRSFTLEKVGSDWQVEGKPEVKVKAEAVNDTLAAVAGLKAERFVVDKGADLKLYGLEPAELTVEVSTPSGRRVLQVGRPEGESKRYYAHVADKDRTDVFIMAEADAARIVRDLPAFRQPATKAAK